MRNVNVGSENRQREHLIQNQSVSVVAKSSSVSRTVDKIRPLCFVVLCEKPKLRESIGCPDLIDVVRMQTGRGVCLLVFHTEYHGREFSLEHAHGSPNELELHVKHPGF